MQVKRRFPVDRDLSSSRVEWIRLVEKSCTTEKMKKEYEVHCFTDVP